MVKKNRFVLMIIFLITSFTFVFSVFLDVSHYENTIIDIDIDIPKGIEVVKEKVFSQEDDKERENDNKYISVKNSYFYKNENYKGSLSISGTDFVEPLYQYSDNDYYLTHDALGRKKSSGTTYIDYRVNNSSRKILIYGHNNNNLSLPFSILENYNYYDYYKEHSYLTLEYDKKTYTYQIFSVYIETSNWDYMNIKFSSNTSWLNHLKDLKSRSFYDTGVEVSKDDRILILQTCSKNKKYSSYDKKYMLVIAKLVK